MPAVRRQRRDGARDPDQRAVLGFLIAKGFETYPVNPWRAGGLIRGRPTYARLADVPAAEAIDMVDVFRNSAAAGGAVDEALGLDPLPAPQRDRNCAREAQL